MAEANPVFLEVNGDNFPPVVVDESPQSRRYSSDDIGCHYRSSLTQLQLPTALDTYHGRGAAVAGVSPHRRQSVATVQLEDRYRSPRHLTPRRRSEFSSPYEKRRKSRVDADLMGEASVCRDHTAVNGVRRSTRSSVQQGVNPYEPVTARLSGSSAADKQRKTSRNSSLPAEEIDAEERRRSRVVLVCASVAVGIFLIAILLVAITLRMSPTIDELGELLPQCTCLMPLTDVSVILPFYLYLNVIE